MENKEEESIVEESKEDSINQEVYSNTYMDSEKIEFYRKYIRWSY